MKKIFVLAAMFGMMLGISGAGTVLASEEGKYRSELTNERISASLMDQRPVAVIVDNESIALPHYGIAEGDIVYELMNSTANGRITRLMVLVKDWRAIRQMGNIRSVRTSNIPLAAEWNAILCHDGGPFYVDAFFAKAYAAQHFSGGFSRVNNGKPSEFTEYILSGDLDAKFAQYGFPMNYNEFASEDPTHFRFASVKNPVNLTEVYGNQAATANEVVLPFPHNRSMLRYNAQTGTYDYYEYDQIHADAEDGQVATFKNVLIQDCTFEVFDENGYMNYNVVDSGRAGYYLTNGYAVPITWTKSSETDLTRYYDMDGNEIKINTGKTYITLVPDDTWADLAIY